MGSENEIKRKIEELKTVMSDYKAQFGDLEKQLFQAVLDYENALRQKKLAELKKEIINSHGADH